MREYRVYKTTNLLNNKFYIGVTKQTTDRYLGSGLLLKKAIEKYGRKNFDRVILHDGLTKNEAYAIEKELVDINDTMSYNINQGGHGGFAHINRLGLPNSMKDPEVVKRNLASRNNNMTPEKKENMRRASIQNLKKAVEVNTGRKRPEHSELMKNISPIIWQENKEKIRDALSGTYQITSPSKNITVTNRLTEFCAENELPFTTIWQSAMDGGRIISKGKAKGWKCIKT